MNCISVSWRTDVEDYIGWFSSLRNNQGLALTGAHNIEVRYGYSLYTMSLAYCFLFVGGVLIFFVPLPPQSSPSQHYTNVCHDCLSVCCKGHVLRRK